MPKKYTTIEVTDDHIARALRRKSGRCVIATAIGTAIEGAHHVDVDLQTIRFTVDGERRVYLTPPAAVGYVVAFDAGDEIHPFAFRLSENHRVIVRQDKATPAAKERRRTARAVHAAEQRKARAQTEVTAENAKPEPDPDTLKIARARARQAARAAAEAAATHAETQARLEGEPYYEPNMTPDPATGQRPRKPPARAYANSTRAYGNRALRINQDKPTPENVAARDSVMLVYNEWAEAERST